MGISEAVKRYAEEAISIIKEKLGESISLHEIRISNRLSRSLGRASIKNQKTNPRYLITISSVAFTEDSEYLRETVHHEVAHIADHQIYNQWGHGKTWKYIMTILGQEPSRYASEEKLESIGHTHVRRKNTRYLVLCERCPKEWHLTSIRIGRLHRYQCTCGGKLYSTGQKV